ncbi:glycosyl transferase, group 1 [Candidatus Koribacter versatilis Ellin345]|uniref:Glycosyl transferase, group 1 n=1 Tax=Koribacter versatilis (strain Ellin345) TaxID=204669 RepID=Q1ILI5_KORVE|nr:glycosyltransferase family 4 protein [Candidatus Koribacter versatilis]ABF42265.1 glycosyl transferase, group 1 [Candidatus Koribacter versatilis Ellin345]
MHVLVTADTIGGVWTYARELVTGLVRRGVRVTLVSFGEIPSPAQTEWLDTVRSVDFRATAFRLEWMQEARDDIDASSEYLHAIIDEVRPDVLHLNQFAYGALKVDIPKIVVAHSDVVSWWASVKGEVPNEIPWMAWYRDVVQSGLEQATTVVAPSRWMLDNVERYYCEPRASSVIYNGRSPLLFNPHVSKEAGIVSVGRLWDSGKQVSLLLHGVARMPITIAGTEQHPDEVFREGSPFAFIDRTRVRVIGHQSEGQLRHIYSRASIYAATSRYEPFGLAPLEAALSRCALVANDIPSFREIWGESACYFDSNDAASLFDALNRMAGNRDLRLTFANLAYNRARQYFNADRMVDEYLALYRKLGARTQAA